MISPFSFFFFWIIWAIRPFFWPAGGNVSHIFPPPAEEEEEEEEEDTETFEL